MRIKSGYLILFLIITSCNFIPPRSGYFGPDRHAGHFINSIQRGEYEKAKEHCTLDVAAYIDSCLKDSTTVNIEMIKDLRCRDPKGLETTCSFCWSTEDYFVEFEMILVGEDWKVSWVPGMKRKNR